MISSTTAAVGNGWLRYQNRLGVASMKAPRWEVAAFTMAMLVTLVHFLDATTIHWQNGASAIERAVQASLALAIPITAALSYPYLKCGWRVALALIFGVAGIATGVCIHVIGVVKNGFGGGDYTGFAYLAAGAVLVLMAVPLLFAFLPNWRWRVVALPVAVLFTTSVAFPLVLAVYITHAPRYEIGAVELGRPHETVSFETRDQLTIRGSYVPSQNGAAVIVLHGSGGARIRPLLHARMLVEHGYGVLLVDTRGHGESEGTTNALGWGALPDVEAAEEYLSGRPDVENGRVGAIGLSMGAEIGLDATSRIDSIRVLVADGAGIRSFNELRSLPLTWRRATEYPTVLVTNAAVSLLSGSAQPPALEGRVGLIETPTLLISSNVAEERDINRIWHAQMNASAELWELSDTGHTAGLRTHPEEYTSRVLDFLDRYLLQ